VIDVDVTLAVDRMVSDAVRQGVDKGALERQDRQLVEAVRKFESLLYSEMVKAMRKTVPQSELFGGGQSEQIYQEMMDAEYAQRLSGSHVLGLTDSLLRQLGRADLAADAIAFKMPVQGELTSSFGSRVDPMTGETRFHDGIDIAASAGERVMATACGTVSAVGTADHLGNFVKVRHLDGFESTYGHLEQISVKQGAMVSPWVQIGTVGSTGRSTGAHLHLELRYNDQPIDPQRYLDKAVLARR